MTSRKRDALWKKGIEEQIYRSHAAKNNILYGNEICINCGAHLLKLHINFAYCGDCLAIPPKERKKLR